MEQLFDRLNFTLTLVAENFNEEVMKVRLQSSWSDLYAEGDSSVHLGRKLTFGWLNAVVTRNAAFYLRTRSLEFSVSSQKKVSLQRMLNDELLKSHNSSSYISYTL